MKKFLFLALVALVSCDPASKIQDNDKQKNFRLNGNTGCVPIVYSDKVYYFPCDDATYGKTLSLFLEDTTRRVSSITGDVNNTSGYWVTIE